MSHDVEELEQDLNAAELEELELDLEEVDLEEDEEDDEPEPTEERDIDAIFGRNQKEEQYGRWFRCCEMGVPGDLIRDLGPKAEVRLARVPNEKYDEEMDALNAKYERRRGGKVPNKVLRKRLPEIYAKYVFVGMKNIRYKGQILADTLANRLMLLRLFQPDLMNALYRHAERLENFQDVVEDDDFDVDAESAESREIALGNS